MWIWNLEKEHFPGATHIVDLFHAREHLGCLAKLLAPVLGEDRAAWLVDRKDELDAGDIPAILAAGRAFDVPAAKAGDLDTTLDYFQTNASRMRYKTFRDAGHFVGSGAVEAGYKAVIGQSLKLSGMRWSSVGRYWHRHPALQGRQRAVGGQSGSGLPLRRAWPDPATYTVAHPTGRTSGFSTRRFLW